LAALTKNHQTFIFIKPNIETLYIRLRSQSYMQRQVSLETLGIKDGMTMDF